MSKPIAICKNDKIFDHESNWNKEIEIYCKEKNIEYEILNPYGTNIICELDKYSAIVWPVQNFVLADLLEANSILRIAEDKGLRVFPNQKTIWHFDDKIAEMYLFQSAGVSIPKSYVFYLLDDCLEWLTHAEFPIVAKIRRGAGSENVILLKTLSQAQKYAKRMFSNGYSPAPSIAFRTKSMLQSAVNFTDIISRVKKIPQFLYTRKHAMQLPVERGYCYFQEFIPNNSYDLKIVVVGNKMSFIGRKTRKNDFRASGSGSLIYDKSLINNSIINSAFDVYDRLGLQCIGFDMVIDNRDNSIKIVEMSYGFDWKALLKSGGYWDRDSHWHDEPIL
jgi:glutathione synthase/RimK-type ligase-like ATP-grasp enzyme